MDYFKTVVPSEANELLEYFDCTYKKVGSGECIKLHRIKAMYLIYPLEIWNVHESTLVLCSGA